jgi:dienelactone hydrolase
MRGKIAFLVTVALLAAAPAAHALNPVVEGKNYSKLLERQQIYDNPQYQLQLNQVSWQNFQDALAIQASDPEREFMTDGCWSDGQICAGDTRLYDWQSAGYGIVQPVLFTARNGSTISGHVWATRAGPARRPGIVITDGSVQADEQMYWYVAQALAKAGYVVFTWDPQGQGRSDTRGEAPDQNEGFPAQTDGRPFFDGTEDAINFFFSTPGHPYVPESSCSTGTSHAAKQARRVREGLDAAYNPFWSLLDGHLGIAGHSYGAAAVSYIGQWDPRVDAIVAWDNLSQASPGTGGHSFPPGELGCPAHPGDRTDMTPQLAAGHGKPALGMSADYFIPPTPNTSDPPSPAYCATVEQRYEQGQAPSQNDGVGCKSLASDGYSHHGIDSGEIVIRGGSHYDFSFIANHLFGASLRGADLISWYTTAWFDRYVKRDPTADRRLLTNRWRHDIEEADVDPDRDGNMFSFYHLSRLDYHTLSGAKVDCEDLRAGCPALSDGDGYPGEYSFAAIDRSPDSGSLSLATLGLSRTCTIKRRVAVRRRHVVRVVAYAAGRRVGAARGRSVRVRLVAFAGRAVRVKLVVTERRHGRLVRLTEYRRLRAC